MHDAYEATAILKKLPLQIESIASFVPDGGSTANLLLGTKVGHLLLYEIDLKKGDNSSVRLLQSVKNFSKKPIIQIAVVPQYHILICLTGYPDNILSVHDMTKARFPALSVVERTRGCHLFTLHVTEETSQTGVVSVIVRLCVAIKKRLQLYYWKNRDFHVLREDLCLPENPKTLVWSGESIFVGMRGGWKEYLRISLTGESEDLFPVGTDGEAKIVAMGQGKIGLMQDKKLVIIKSDVFMKSDVMKSDGQPILDSVTWTDHPVAIECDGPYLVGVMSTGVEIQTIEPRMIIQTLALACESREKPKLMSNCQLGLVFLASNYDVWALKATPFNDQIGQLLRLKQFELALRLSEFGTYVDGEREKLVQYIETLHAFDLFCKFNFQDAMSIFLVLDIDPSNVIGLFPDLLPAVFQNQLNFPDKVPELRGHSLENGLLALKDYLVEVRNRLKDNRSKFSLKPIAEGSTTIRSKEKLLQIIDTTLVKCFLQTTDALVTPFLRLQDNKCHLEETERALTKFGKLSELVILYKANGQHRKALFLLQKQAKRPESPLAGTERTVSYLQHLGQDHLELLFEFSTWVMLENPEDGLKIFVDDVPEVEQLPRARVMSHIRDKAPELLVPYLEHVIFEWKDESPALHDTLAERYQATVQALQNAVGPAGDRLNECRKKLKKFLEFSTCFTPERVLMRLPAEGFYKERAILYEKMGKHDRALAVYVYLLEDLPAAKAYCQRIAKLGEKTAAGEAFLSLLKLMISPPNASVLGSQVTRLKHEENFCADAGLRNAIQLLEEHPTCMDPCQVMKLLPSAVPLEKLFQFFKCNLYHLSKSRKELQLLKGLNYSQLLQVHVQRMELQSQKIVLTELRTCPGCKKRFISHCAFAHYPNGDLVHYSCMEKYENLKL